MARTVEKRMAFYFDENGQNQLKWNETSARESAQTVKIHYSAQFFSALSNSAQRSIIGPKYPYSLTEY
jgi:cytochrome c oxidase assembly protein Cox11